MSRKQLYLKQHLQVFTTGKIWQKPFITPTRDRILVTDEIGYGIVPIDPFEREYREETGRICCLLAEKSEEVWRVCCGIGTRLK